MERGVHDLHSHSDPAWKQTKKYFCLWLLWAFLLAGLISDCVGNVLSWFWVGFAMVPVGGRCIRRGMANSDEELARTV